MRKLPLLFFLLMLSQSVLAQRDVTSFVHFTGGLSYALGKEIGEVYDFGFSVATHATIPINKIILEPGVRFQYFGNYYNEGIRDNLLLWNFGSRIHLNNTSRFDPFVGAYYLFGKDYLAPRKDYNGNKVDLMTFRGLGISAGLNFYLSDKLYLQLIGDFVKPKARLDEDIQDDIKEDLEATSSLYNIVTIPDNKISFNTISIKVGYKLSVK